MGQERDDRIRQLHAERRRLLVQDGQPSLDVRGLEVGSHSPLEAGNQPLLQALNLVSRPVAGQDDLLVSIMESIEGVKKLLLDALFALKELDVIDQQHIEFAVLLAKLGQLAVLQRFNELVGEPLARQVADTGVLLVGQNVMTDGLE